mmetsp:Transcript_74837/g.129730  ORF Transcript_74837/g.129730 Transcript_74837/m.129730 type:complete len:91 (-) Transcript_74837:873-1145(-)
MTRCASSHRLLPRQCPTVSFQVAHFLLAAFSAYASSRLLPGAGKLIAVRARLLPAAAEKNAGRNDGLQHYASQEICLQLQHRPPSQAHRP